MSDPFFVTKKGGCFVPYGHYAEACFDDLPGGIPLVARFSDSNKSKRFIEQSNLMWSLLGQLSKQLKWHGVYYTDYQWKDCLTAAQKGQKLMPGIDGGLVAIGGRTRDMTIAEMASLIDLIMNFGAREGVVFREVEPA